MSPTTSSWVKCPFMYIRTYPLSLRAFTVGCPSAAALVFTLTGRSDMMYRHGCQWSSEGKQKNSIWKDGSKSFEIIWLTESFEGGTSICSGSMLEWLWCWKSEWFREVNEIYESLSIPGEAWWFAEQQSCSVFGCSRHSTPTQCQHCLSSISLIPLKVNKFITRDVVGNATAVLREWLRSGLWECISKSISDKSEQRKADKEAFVLAFY